VEWTLTVSTLLATGYTLMYGSSPVDFLVGFYWVLTITRMIRDHFEVKREGAQRFQFVGKSRN
jgi:hypothetical protein